MTKLESFLTVIVTCIAVGAVWPFSFWYDLGQYAIDDVASGQPVEIRYDGGAVRSFTGSYSVTVRRVPEGSVVCDASGGPLGYIPTSERPYPLTMAWWAPSDARCNDLPSGVFISETCWTVHRPFHLPINRVGCVKSNVFEVMALTPTPNN